ncbi:hypothetical protein AAHC03_05385 [Spirometra sp. Aus1]|nr:unnamed protein product [Spirometra erinaceieuropaei]
MSAAGQAYSLRAKDRDERIEIPEHNYREGGFKSQYFRGGWYVPSERRWEKYYEHHFLPPLTRRDAIDFSRESEYVDFKRKTNKHYEKSLLGHIPQSVPYVKWNGHRRIPQEPCTSTFEPKCFGEIEWDGPGYYGYYHEALDMFNREECRPPRPGCCQRRCIIDSRVILD